MTKKFNIMSLTVIRAIQREAPQRSFLGSIGQQEVVYQVWYQQHDRIGLVGVERLHSVGEQERRGNFTYRDRLYCECRRCRRYQGCHWLPALPTHKCSYSIRQVSHAVGILECRKRRQEDLVRWRHWLPLCSRPSRRRERLRRQIHLPNVSCLQGDWRTSRTFRFGLDPHWSLRSTLYHVSHACQSF